MNTHSLAWLALIVYLFAWPVQSNEGPSIDDIIAQLSPRLSETKTADMPHWKQVSQIHMLVPDFFLPKQADDVSDWLEDKVDARVVVLKSPEELAEVQHEVEALVGWCAFLDGEFPKLVWIQNLSAGVEGCTGKTQFDNDRVLVTNGASTSGPAIAEWVIGVMFMLQRRFIEYSQYQADATWARRQAIPAGVEINGKTILIVGLGGIGRQIAWRAKGLGMRVVATRNSSRTGPDYVDYVGLADEIDTLVGKADVIVNATPLTKKTRNLFNKKLFDKMKPSAVFINVGRGGSVVQDDLVSALKSGSIHAAALDVTTPEPLPKDSELWQLPNVFITPHHSSRTEEFNMRLWLLVRENMRRLVAGDKVFNLVDLDRGY